MPLPTQWVTLPAFGASAYMPSIVLERALFVRERNDGLYRVITYLIAKMIDELVLAVVGTLGVSLFVWFGVGLVGSFANFWLASSWPTWWRPWLPTWWVKRCAHC